MSVVGPRPERPEIEGDSRTTVAAWQRWWFVKPGMTWLAQINRTTGHEPARKLEYDVAYIRRQSFAYDLKLVARQLWLVLRDAAELLSRGRRRESDGRAGVIRTRRAEGTSDDRRPGPGGGFVPRPRRRDGARDRRRGFRRQPPRRRALVPRNEVRVLDDLSSGRRERVPAGETLVEGDIRDARTLDRAIDGADVIFHQAGVVSVDRSVEAPCGATR